MTKWQPPPFPRIADVRARYQKFYLVSTVQRGEHRTTAGEEDRRSPSASEIYWILAAAALL